MPIEFLCNFCSTKLRVPDGTEGKQTQCPKCSQRLTIPGSPLPHRDESPLAPPAGGNPFTGHPPSGLGGYQIPPPPASPGEAEGPADYPQPATPSDNPYQAPTASFGPVAPPWVPIANAADQVRAPAIGLLVASILGIVFSLGGTVFVVAAMAVAPDEFGAADLPFQVLPNLISLLIGIAVGTVGILGSISMLQLRRRGLAMAGAILMAVPCFSPCCPLGLPFGIWSLVVLSDGAVQAAFRS